MRRPWSSLRPRPSPSLRLWAEFAEYGFPKSHAVAYALLTYKTAYLKVHHPAQWMAAQMSTVMSSTERVGRYVRVSTSGAYGPSARHYLSDVAFKARDGAVYYGLAAVKHVGESFAANVAAIRAQKAYASLTEFLARVPARAPTAGRSRAWCASGRLMLSPEGGSGRWRSLSG